MVEYRFEPHILNLKGFFNPFTNEIWVNGKYKAEELEPLIELIFTHENIHSIILKLEGCLTSRQLDKSKAVELIEVGGIY
jgi:hypothetical protein